MTASPAAKKKSKSSKDNAQVRRMKVTPQLAAKWLATQAVNRPITKSHVESLKRDMINGKWQFNGDPIRFNVNGELVDGQHRLQACIESECSFESIVVRGLPVEAMAVIDINKHRTFGDHLAITGAGLDGIASTKVLASLARMVWYYERKGAPFMGQGREKPTHFELEDVLARHASLGDAVLHTYEVSKSALLASRSMVTWVYWMAKNSKVAQAEELAEEWLEAFCTGENLPPKHPVLAARSRIISARMGKGRHSLSRRAILAILIKSWNFLAQGKEAQKIQFGATDVEPELVAA